MVRGTRVAFPLEQRVSLLSPTVVGGVQLALYAKTVALAVVVRFVRLPTGPGIGSVTPKCLVGSRLSGPAQGKSRYATGTRRADAPEHTAAGGR
jgi:hypothetical protein